LEAHFALVFSSIKYCVEVVCKNLKNLSLYMYLYVCIVLSFDLCLVDFSCDFANGFLRFVVINDLLSFLCITNLERLFLFPRNLVLKRNFDFSLYG